ncbi:hypothetical protein J6590_059720 [Homalodisca vitripennis]|nr:hypothetical protein J6590_059720 [Homalodisca vitripennis]
MTRQLKEFRLSDDSCQRIEQMESGRLAHTHTAAKAASEQISGLGLDWIQMLDIGDGIWFHFSYREYDLPIFADPTLISITMKFPQKRHIVSVVILSSDHQVSHQAEVMLQCPEWPAGANDRFH